MRTKNYAKFLKRFPCFFAETEVFILPTSLEKQVWKLCYAIETLIWNDPHLGLDNFFVREVTTRKGGLCFYSRVNKGIMPEAIRFLIRDAERDSIPRDRWDT